MNFYFWKPKLKKNSNQWFNTNYLDGSLALSKKERFIGRLVSKVIITSSFKSCKKLKWKIIIIGPYYQLGECQHSLLHNPASFIYNNSSYNYIHVFIFKLTTQSYLRKETDLRKSPKHHFKKYFLRKIGQCPINSLTNASKFFNGMGGGSSDAFH